MSAVRTSPDIRCWQVSDIIMTGSETKTKMKASEFRFKPVRGWLGGEQAETIEGWKTKVFEANGKLNSVTTHKVRTSTAPFRALTRHPAALRTPSASRAAKTGRWQLRPVAVQGKLVIPEGASFEDYLVLMPEEDRTEVQPVDLFSLGPGSKAASPEVSCRPSSGLVILLAMALCRAGVGQTCLCAPHAASSAFLMSSHGSSVLVNPTPATW